MGRQMGPLGSLGSVGPGAAQGHGCLLGPLGLQYSNRGPLGLTPKKTLFKKRKHFFRNRGDKATRSRESQLQAPLRVFMATIAESCAFLPIEAAVCEETQADYLSKEAREKLADHTKTAWLAADAQAKAAEVARNLSQLIRVIDENELKSLLSKAAEAQAALRCIEALAEGAVVPQAYWAALTKSEWTDRVNKQNVGKLRRMLRVPRTEYYFKESDSSVGDHGIVSNPSSPFLALGPAEKKGSMGPNVAASGDHLAWDVNAIAPTEDSTVETVRLTLEMCASNALFVLEALLELVKSVPELKPHAAVFSSLVEVAKAYTESDGCSPSEAVARVGLSITSLCQTIGHASVPHIHSQQLVKIGDAALVFHALSESSHTVDEIAAALSAYLDAQEHYVSVALAEYEGKFVMLTQLLEVAESASRASRARSQGTKRDSSALDE